MKSGAKQLTDLLQTTGGGLAALNLDPVFPQIAAAVPLITNDDREQVIQSLQGHIVRCDIQSLWSTSTLVLCQATMLI